MKKEKIIDLTEEDIKEIGITEKDVENMNLIIESSIFVEELNKERKSRLFTKVIVLLLISSTVSIFSEISPATVFTYAFSVLMFITAMCINSGITEINNKLKELKTPIKSKGK